MSGMAPSQNNDTGTKVKSHSDVKVVGVDWNFHHFIVGYTNGIQQAQDFLRSSSTHAI